MAKNDFYISPSVLRMVTPIGKNLNDSDVGTLRLLRHKIRLRKGPGHAASHRPARPFF